jgi:hypothetical protein
MPTDQLMNWPTCLLDIWPIHKLVNSPNWLLANLANGKCDQLHYLPTSSFDIRPINKLDNNNTDQLTYWMANLLTKQLANFLNEQPDYLPNCLPTFDQFTLYQLTNLQTDQLANWSTCQETNLLTHQLRNTPASHLISLLLTISPTHQLPHSPTYQNSNLKHAFYQLSPHPQHNQTSWSSTRTFYHFRHSHLPRIFSVLKIKVRQVVIQPKSLGTLQGVKHLLN